MRHVKRRRRLLAEAVVSDVAQDADNFDVAGALGRVSESPPDRILTRKEFSRRRLVDDRHLRRAPVVTVGEPASGDERYSHRGEIVRRDDDTVDVVALSVVAGALAGVVPA